MGTKQSVLCTSQQNFLPAYRDDDVMSDCSKVKSVGFFGFRGPSTKGKSHDSETDKMHDSTNSTSATKEMAKSATLESTDVRKKKFGFRAPVRSASTVCSGTGERPAVKANNGTSLLCSKGKSSPFRPPGMESWKMIDDDNASGRSRSSSREKTLKVEPPKKNNAPMTSSLPVNLNNSRLPGLMNRLTRSHTISAQASANDDSKECEVPAEGALTPDQSNAVTKSVPGFLKRPKGFLFSSLSQRKSGTQRRETSKPETTGVVSVVSTPEQMHSSIQANPKADKASEAGEHVGDHETESCETETQSEKIGDSSNLESSPTLKKSEATSKAKKDSGTDSDESRKSSQLEVKQSAIVLSRKNSGKGSSLDKSHLTTAKSSASHGHQTLISDAPLASLDFDDECSICSDDLMLDVDIAFDAEESTLYGSRQSSISETVKKRLSNPRLSSSVPFPSENAVGSEQKVVERHSSLVRRQRSGLERGPGQASDRRLQPRLSTASIDSKLLPGGDKCALEELMSLMEASKVIPKSENSSDGKTFSGSGDGTGGHQVRRQVSMKPPRQSSLIEDDELVVIDGFAYRNMLQELTSMKTMLFRLKRMLQEDELGQPSFNHSVFKSNSDQTFVLQSDDLKIQNRDSELSLTQLQEENSALLSMVRLLQQTVDDQKKTIVLFQQQMTKYECGMTETTKASDK